MSSTPIQTIIDSKLSDVFESLGLNLSEIPEGDLLSNHGLDSLMTMELVLRIEAAFNIAIPDEMLTTRHLGTTSSIKNMLVGLCP